MENVSYITNLKGEKIALQINLRPRKKLSFKDIEEIEDIISYELTKDEPNLDYRTEMEILKTAHHNI